jgi:hypothetical protein
MILHHSLVQMVGILRKMQFGTQPLDEAKRRLNIFDSKSISG